MVTWHRVAVTVFVEVDDAVNARDAGRVGEHLVRGVLPVGEAHEVKVRDQTWTVVVHEVMETGAAVNSGYLVVTPASKAYRDGSPDRAS